MDNSQRIERMQQLLEQELATEQLDITDDSHLHEGHAGARDGAGHFTVTIISAAFAGKSPIERHRQVYSALGDMIGPEIHALSITALTPDEL